MDTIFLQEFHEVRDANPTDVNAVIEKLCNSKIEDMIEEATVSVDEQDGIPKLPLIRLRVDCSGGFEQFSGLRFGQRFVHKVANPKDLFLFSRRNPKTHGDDAEVREGFRSAARTGVDSDKIIDINCVEYMVRDLFAKADDKMRMQLLSEKKIGLGVQCYVEKNSTAAISSAINHEIKSATGFLCQSPQQERIRDAEDIRKMLELKRHSDKIKREQSSRAVDDDNNNDGEKSKTDDLLQSDEVVQDDDNDDDDDAAAAARKWSPDLLQDNSNSSAKRTSNRSGGRSLSKRQGFLGNSGQTKRARLTFSVINSDDSEKMDDESDNSVEDPSLQSFLPSCTLESANLSVRASIKEEALERIRGRGRGRGSKGRVDTRGKKEEKNADIEHFVLRRRKG